MVRCKNRGVDVVFEVVFVDGDVDVFGDFEGYFWYFGSFFFCCFCVGSGWFF